MNNPNKDCSTCQTCQDTLRGVNNKLISIADKLLYNSRFGLNREVDRNLFRLLSFYKDVLTDFINEEDCGCYTHTLICSQDVPNIGYPDTVINHCVCGCCPPLNVVCNFNPNVGKDSPSSTDVTEENIIERIKILTA